MPEAAGQVRGEFREPSQPPEMAADVPPRRPRQGFGESDRMPGHQQCALCGLCRGGRAAGCVETVVTSSARRSRRERPRVGNSLRDVFLGATARGWDA